MEQIFKARDSFHLKRSASSLYQCSNIKKMDNDVVFLHFPEIMCQTGPTWRPFPWFSVRDIIIGATYFLRLFSHCYCLKWLHGETICCSMKCYVLKISVSAVSGHIELSIPTFNRKWPRRPKERNLSISASFANDDYVIQLTAPEQPLSGPCGEVVVL